MSEDAVLLLFLGGLVVAAMLAIAWKAYEWKLVWWAIVAPFWLSFKILKGSGWLGSRALLRAGRGRERVQDPATAELVERKAINPVRTPRIQHLEHGHHFTVGGIVEAVHKAVIGMAGSGKNQTDLNYELQYQLQYSDEHLILTDPKTNAPMTRIARAYAEPNDRVFVYSFHPKDPESSSLRLFRDPTELSDLAFLLTDEPNAKDSHWNEKGAELIAAVATAITEQRRQAEQAAALFSGLDSEHDREITATLNEVRDVIADRRKLDEMREASPLVDNVADEPREWGYIRSTASRRLSALNDLTVRRVMAGGANTTQPNFERRDGRDIVIFRPHPRSANRLARYIFAGLDTTYRAAADAGDAGGPGTKVLIDEAASYMRLENLAEYQDLGRESKVQLTYVLQGTKQLTARLGREKAEHILSSTEVKVVGATADNDTAKMVSELSAPQTVHYRHPAQANELVGRWTGKERRQIEVHEITSQGEGEWVIQQQGKPPRKVRVPKKAYHYTQAAEPREHWIWGLVDPSTYEVPAILGSAEDDRDERRDCGDEQDDLLDAPHDDSGEWLD